MKSFLKIFAVVFLIMALGVAAISALMYVAFRNAGFATVAVHDRREGIVVTTPVPLLPVHLVTTVLGAFPVHVEWNHHDVPDVHRELNAMLAEIESAPDATLFEIHENGDHITIAKRGTHLEVNVDDRWDEVTVSVPIQTVRRVTRSLR